MYFVLFRHIGMETLLYSWVSLCGCTESGGVGGKMHAELRQEMSLCLLKGFVKRWFQQPGVFYVVQYK